MKKIAEDGNTHFSPGEIEKKLPAEIKVFRRFYLKTFGCQMNLYDSWLVEDYLMRCGFIPTDKIREADIIVFNTCTVRQHAEDRALSHIGKLKRIKDETKKVFVIGCVAARLGEELKKKFPFIDEIITPERLNEFPKILSEKASLPLEPCVDLRIENKRDDISSFIAITRGCDNYCSYCIVPYVRGNLKSRSATEIINEIKLLIEKGIKEFILLGQNVNSYCDPDNKSINFSKLLQFIHDIKGVEKIGFLTNHPKDFSDELIDVIASNEKIYKSVHLPLQAGSDRILNLMNRKYTTAYYFELVSKLYEKVKNISITTDIIVGFPTETELDFQRTVSMVERCEFDSCFCFKYSPRPGTKSAELKDDVDLMTKDERLQKILEISEKIALKKNKKLNTIQDVFITKIDDNKIIGKTKNNKKVEITTEKINKNILLGKEIKVKITNVTAHKLTAKLL